MEAARRRSVPMVSVSAWKNWALKVQMTTKSRPNFFVSFPYIAASNARFCSNDNWMWIEADGVCLFPPVALTCPPSGPPPVDYVWSDFDGDEAPLPGYEPEFLDWEYIYDPKDFFEHRMTGKKWATFRKNVRKWPRRHPGSKVVVLANPEGDNAQVRNLVANWLERKENEAEDPEVLVTLALDPPPGTGHMYVVDGEDRIAAAAIWDVNWEYVNFRFLIAREDPFLDEFSRWSLLMYVAQAFPRKLVNDGGTLGKEGLERFKDRLNPVRKRKVNSWRRR